MIARGIYMIVCEGASECNYLEHLNRFLSRLPPPAQAGQTPLQFIPKPSQVDPRTGRKAGCGGGSYAKVSKVYRSEWIKNQGYPFGIWVDADLYIRNDKDNFKAYSNRPGGIPDFLFSIFNFEDFLALHATDEVFEKWRAKMQQAGHFQSPLHWTQYEPLYREFFPVYQKGRLADDFMETETLCNFLRHWQMVAPLANLGCLTGCRTFADLLANVLRDNYPDLFGAV